MVDGSRLRLSAGVACLAFAGGVLMGCSAAHERQVGFVSGTVTCDGRPLTSGVVIFTPVELEGGANVSDQDFAKGARGLVNPDGPYQLSTYPEDDGAAVGVHEVRVMQLDPDDDDAPVENGGFACSQEVVRVTVEKGSNTIDIALSR